MKSIWLIVACLFAVACAAQASQVVVNPACYLPQGVASNWIDPELSSIELHLNFETTNVTQTLDVSGNAYHASNLNGCVWTILGTNENGRVEHGYAFSGTNQAFIFGSNLFATVTDFTWAAWLKPAADNVVPLGGGATGKYWWLNTGGNIYYSVASGNYVLGALVPTLNEWTHFAMRRSGTNFWWYTNGVLATSDTQAGWESSAVSLLFVGELSAGNFEVTGLMDDVVVYIPCASVATILERASKTHPTNNIEVRP